MCVGGLRCGRGGARHFRVQGWKERGGVGVWRIKGRVRGTALERGVLGASAGAGGSVRVPGSRNWSHTRQRGGGCSRDSRSNSALCRYAERSQGRREGEELRRR